MNKFILIISCVIVFQCCNNSTNNEKLSKNRVYKKDSLLIVEEYYDNGILSLVKNLTLDSTNFGAEILYHKNGKIKKWKWFTKNNKYPDIIINYDSAGNYRSFKGKPFLNARSSNSNKDNLIIQVVNPPSLKYFVRYRDFDGGDIINRQTSWDPGIESGTGWVTIKNHKYEEGHKYFMYYYFMKNNKIIDSAYVEMAP